MNLSELEGKRVLITGASGLIGQALISYLSEHRGKKPIEILALVRNRERAQKVFADFQTEHLSYLECDVLDLKPINIDVNYIIHGASRTASRDFVEHPVEVIRDSVKGTENLLEFARVNPIESFVYLSTMEVYGAPDTDGKIAESHVADLDAMAVRSCYPESKRLCECLCASYFTEYSVPTKVVRLTQTFGEGVAYSDNRVFAEFARCVIEGRNIVLKTKGETKRNYLYTKDAATAILTVLLKGKNKEAYNAANEETYCSIYEMACLVSEKFGRQKTAVIVEESNIEAMGYAPSLKMNLSSEKLRALGWRPTVGLEAMYERMIEDMKKRAN